MFIYCPIVIVGRVFSSDPGDWCSIPGQVIPIIEKIVLDASLLNSIIWYGLRVKLSNPEKSVAASPTPQCSS